MEIEEHGTDSRDLVHEICAMVCGPEEGRSFWIFIKRERRRSLTPQEIIDHLESGRGILALEMVWDQDQELRERGAGVVLKSMADLRRLYQSRIKAFLSDLARRLSSQASGRPMAPDGLAPSPAGFGVGGRSGIDKTGR